MLELADIDCLCTANDENGSTLQGLLVAPTDCYVTR
jgi:hypothetical protein